eukprot:COSAG01_NODE_1441_length_10293_cov_4.232392_19_plen_109_part_00
MRSSIGRSSRPLTPTAHLLLLLALAGMARACQQRAAGGRTQQAAARTAARTDGSSSSSGTIRTTVHCTVQPVLAVCVQLCVQGLDGLLLLLPMIHTAKKDSSIAYPYM